MDGLKDSLLYGKEDEKEDPVPPAVPTPADTDAQKTTDPKSQV
jgi:hypothetical protein